MNNLLIIKFVENVFLFYILFICFNDFDLYYVPIDTLENLNLVTKFKKWYELGAGIFIYFRKIQVNIFQYIRIIYRMEID